MKQTYWLGSALGSLMYTLAGILFYSAIIFLQQEKGMADFISMLPLYLTLMGAVMQAVSMLRLYKLQLPLVLSFGSTRREARIGMLLYRLLPALVISGLSAACAALSAGSSPFSPAEAFLLTLGVILLGSAFGTVMSIVSLRFGRLGTLLTMLCAFLLGGAGGLLTLLTPAPAKALLVWLVLLVGVAAQAILFLWEIRVLRKYQVRI